MENYRIVFSDLDGTLLCSSHELTERTRQAVRGLTAAGVGFVPASSRMPSGIYPFCADLGIACPIIAYGGALALEANGARLYEAALTDFEAQEILLYLNRSYPELCCCLYSGNSWLAQRPADPWIQLEREITGLTPRPLADSDRIPCWHKVMCMGEAELIARVCRETRERFPNVSVFPSKDTFLEIQSPQASKASALRAVCRAYGIDPAQTVAFGDHENDAAMLEAAGLAVAMGNATPGLKRLAARIAPDNDQDGVAAVLAELFGLKLEE